MTLPLALSLVLPTAALAEEETVRIDAIASSVWSESDLSAESAMSGGLELGLRADVRRLYGSLEGRGIGQDLWTGRAAAGIDLLGMSDMVDIDVGVFSGAGGSLAAGSELVGFTPLVGLEFGLGLDIGRFSGSYRHGQELAAGWTEERVRLGLELGDRTEVFGQLTRLTPGEQAARDSVGIGLAMKF